MKTPAAPEKAEAVSPGGRQRLDKYLWFARVVKSRTLAAKLVGSGHVRVNSERVVTPAKAVAPGDVLTISLDRQVRVLKVLAPGSRRGPYEEARLLYEDLTEPASNTGQAGADAAETAMQDGGPVAEKGRPDKRARREGAGFKRMLQED
ncbi:MAG: RNA-binding S4 domain-containing protein [Beijerinckiaceae bacterium]